MSQDGGRIGHKSYEPERIKLTMEKKQLSGVKRIIAHAMCADGVMGAAICRWALPGVGVEFHQYGTPNFAQLEPAAGMLFVDICPPPHLVSNPVVLETAIVLDHHKGVEDTIKLFGERGIFADERSAPGVSGAVLAYQHVLVPAKGPDNEVLDAAILVGIRDTYQKDHQRWDQACWTSNAVRFYGADYWLTRKPVVSEEQRLVGRLGVEARERQIKEALGNVEYLEVRGTRFAVFCDGKGLVSDLSELLRREGRAQVCVGFFYVRNPGDPTLKLVYSLRSDGSWDCASFAKSLGGGGHTKAAGFSVPADAWARSPFVIAKSLLES